MLVAFIDGLVSDVLHRYESISVDAEINNTESAQNDRSEPKSTFGLSFTVTFTDVLFKQSFASVTVTVYFIFD